MKIDYSQASQEIQSRHFFTRKESALANFERFFSADPRFPFSIAYPQELEPSYNDTEYLNILYVTFGKGTFGIMRSDITHVMEPEDQRQPALQIPLSTSPQIDDMLAVVKNWGDAGASFEVKLSWQAEKGKDFVTVGEPGFKASRVVVNTGGDRYSEWVIFQSRLTLWTIFRNPILSFSAGDFNTILRSFRFLDEAFFHALGVRWSSDSEGKEG